MLNVTIHTSSIISGFIRSAICPALYYEGVKITLPDGGQIALVSGLNRHEIEEVIKFMSYRLFLHHPTPSLVLQP